METKYYSSTVEDTTYSLVSTPISSINLDVFVDAFYGLGCNILLDGYSIASFKKFHEEGYVESRVKNAPQIDEADQMIVFSYDADFNSPVGVAIIFDKKFYAISMSFTKRAESELLNIYKHKTSW